MSTTTPWERFKSHYSGKKILVMGLGLHGGGVSVAKTFVEAGCPVTITDLKTKKQLQKSLRKLKNTKNLSYTLGCHRESDFVNADVILRNPAVPKSSVYLKQARAKRIPVKMETALFARYCPIPIIGITGTRGKSTTAFLTHKILAAAGHKVLLSGNLPGSCSLASLKNIADYDLVVLELSSWQLQGFATEKISPHVAVVTNIYPDHLNRYRSMLDYIEDKKIIVKFQKPLDYAILNRMNLLSVRLRSSTKAYVRTFSESEIPIKLKVPGIHNSQNAAAALRVAQVFSVSKAKGLKVLSTFTGIPYRLESVAKKNGITFINDTTSTTPTATIKALESIQPPLILLLGGQTKNLPVEQLAQLINNNNVPTILISGTGTEEIKPLIKRSLVIKEFNSQHQAVKLAFEQANKQTTILFSPGFTSFNNYENEFDRGKDFNKSVKNVTS